MDLLINGPSQRHADHQTSYSLVYLCLETFYEFVVNQLLAQSAYPIHSVYIRLEYPC